MAARPVTTAEIVAWSEEGIAGQEMVRRIEESGTVFRLRSQDVVDLRERGVPGEVVDAMLQTWVDAESHRARDEAARRAREAAWDPWWGPWWWDDPWWWGYPYPYRPYWYRYPRRAVGSASRRSAKRQTLSGRGRSPSR